MLNNSRFSIIIPCYNEEKGLETILESMPDFIDEVIVVDNGCDDNSVQVAQSYNAKVLTEKTRGYGRAILRGLSYASGDILVTIDGDGSYPVKILKEICTYMEKDGFDFISGCRFPLVDFKAMPFINIFSNYFVSWLVRFLFKINLRDSQSGMMLFKKNLLNEIEVNNKGMGFSQEIKIKSWLNSQIKCSEFRIPYSLRLGKAKFNKIRDGMKNLYDVLILWAKINASL